MKIIRIIKDIIKLHKIRFPNTSFKRQYIVDVYNIWYALKNILNEERKFIQPQNLNLTEMWSKYNSYIEFQHKYYSKKDYLFGPAIKAVTGGFHRNSKNRIRYKIKIKEQENLLKGICIKLEETFPSINFNQWHDNLSMTFAFLNSFNKDEIDIYNKLKNMSVVEFGPGSGIHSLLYQSISTQSYALYDLPQMQNIQKFLHQEYYIDDINKLNKFNYFSDLPNLDKFLNERQFCFISQWAFSETPMSLRIEFEKILAKSEFALFISNTVMSGVDNDKYFKDLSNRLIKHNYLSTYLHDIKNLPNFMKKHKIHLFYKVN